MSTRRAFSSTIICLAFIIQGLQAQPWTYTNTGTSHTIIIPASIAPTADGVALTSGDYIGVFFGANGAATCAGYVIWTGTSTSLAAFGDDATTTDKDGFTPGEQFQIRVWRHGDGKDGPAIVQYSPISGIITNTGTYAPNGISRLASLQAAIVPPVLSVTPPDRPVSSDAGTTTFTVNNIGSGTMPWTAKSDQDWASIISGNSGTNSGTIAVNYSVNASTSISRVATITVDAPSASNTGRQVTITQAPAQAHPILTVTPLDQVVNWFPAGTTTIDVKNTGKGTMHWTAISDQTWATITSGASGTNDGTITIAYEEWLTPAQARTARITVTADGATNSPQYPTVRQPYRMPIPHQPIISPVDTTLLPQPCMLTFKVENGGDGTMPWTARSDQAWAVITSGAEGSSGHFGQNPGYVTVSVQANNTIDLRTASITITPSTTGPVSARIHQKGSDKVLSVEPSSQFVNWHDPGTTTVSVKNIGRGTMQWTARSNQSWAKIISGSSGTNDGTITVAYEEWLEPYPERKASIIVTAPGAAGSPDTALIIQPERWIPIKKTPNIAPMDTVVSSSAGIATFKVMNEGDGDMHWRAGSDQAWAVVTSGTPGVSGHFERNPGYVSVSIAANKDTSARQARLTIYPEQSDFVVPIWATINQRGADHLITIVITPAPLPSGMEDRSYSQTFSALGGVAPYTWSIEGGELPSGLSLSTSGTLSGTPTVVGSFNITIKARDAASNSGTRQYTLVIASPLLISTPSPLPSGKIGIPYNIALTAIGGTSPYTWSLVSGTIPPGILMSADALFSGIPTQAGQFSFTVKVTDHASFSTLRSFTLEITEPLIITTASPLPRGEIDVPYSYQLNATGGKPPYVWSAKTGELPPGYTLSSEGRLSGTSNSAGSWAPNIMVKDVYSDSTKKIFELMINPLKLMIISPSRLPDGWVNEYYGAGFSSSGGIGRKWWSAYPLPKGLSSSLYGLIYGTPTDTGTFIFKVEVSDTWNNSATQTDTLRIKQMHIVLDLLPPPGRVGEAYSYQFTAVDGARPYLWRVATGALPPALTLSDSGMISGTPSIFGSFPVGIEVTDSASRKDTVHILLTVNPLSLEIITTSLLPCAMKGYAYQQQLEARGGLPPYTWSLYSGLIPQGLTISSSGAVSGMTSDTGAFSFAAQMTDSKHATQTKSFSLMAHQTLRMTNSLPLIYAMVNRPYGMILSAEGGTAPYRWNLSGAGIFNQVALSEDGRFSGVPSMQGLYPIKISLKDKENFSSESDCMLSIKEELQIIIPGEMPIITVGASIRFKLAARGGALPYRWSIIHGSLPLGIILSPEGELIGSPAQSGTYPFTIQVEDSASYRDMENYSLGVNSGLTILIDAVLPKGMVGERYELVMPHSGGTGPYAWRLAKGSLPDGISLAVDGTLSGTPTAPGKFEFTLELSDGGGASVTKDVTLQITPTLKILTAALPEGMVEESYEDTLKAEGGIPPYVWSVKNESLPEGLSLSALGVLSGSPFKAGMDSFTLELKDSVGHVVDHLYTLTINNPHPELVSLSDTIKFVGDDTFTLSVNGMHFVSTATIHFNASPRATTYVNASRLTTPVMPADMAVEDTLYITVVNDPPGGGVSDSRKLYIKRTTGIQVDRLSGIPSVFVIEQNYPNPFNPSTTIRFGVPSASFVTLTIFDALGRHIASLINQDLSAGYYSVPFDALGISSGIYLYRLSVLPRSGSTLKPFVQTKKLLLLR